MDAWREPPRAKQWTPVDNPCTPSVVAESRPQGCLGRSPGSEGANISSADVRQPLHLPRPLAEWSFEATCLPDSGGTAPDLHRTSLLCPSWAPKADRGYTTAVAE
jgi:hypothetical protein